MRSDADQTSVTVVGQPKARRQFVWTADICLPADMRTRSESGERCRLQLSLLPQVSSKSCGIAKLYMTGKEIVCYGHGDDIPPII